MTVIPPSPRYCLRKSPAGFLYVIPFIYDYDWSEWCRHVGTGAPGPWPVPQYADAVHLELLTFERPLEISG